MILSYVRKNDLVEIHLERYEDATVVDLTGHLLMSHRRDIAGAGGYVLHRVTELFEGATPLHDTLAWLQFVHRQAHDTLPAH